MWLSASLLYVSKKAVAVEEDELWEEVVVILDVADADAAKSTARAVGVKGEHDYVAFDGGNVAWVFIGIGSVYELLAPPASGEEVFARYLSRDVAQRFLMQEHKPR